MNYRLCFCFCFCIFLLCSCGKTTKQNLPPASGNSGDIYLVMDSTQWKGSLGEVIDSLFHIDMPGLPRKEPIFRMRWIDPRKLNFVLKARRNLIFVFTLDQSSAGINKIKSFFTPESLSLVKTNKKKYVTTASDIYAKGQEVMYLYGSTERSLIANIRKKGRYLIDYFNRQERRRLSASLFKSGEVKGVGQWLKKNFQCGLRIPFGYKLVERDANFLWVRQINPKDDKTIFIARTDYTSQSQFEKEALIRFRDQICKKYLFEDPEVADSYLVTETTIPFIPVTTNTLNFHNQYAVKMRGLWRANNFSMGGPFVSYAFADEATQKFYYIEGLTFSPGKDQREIMRELETILGTFKTSTEIKKQLEPIQSPSGS